MDLDSKDGRKTFLSILESPVPMRIENFVDIQSVEHSIRTIQQKIDGLVACQQALRGVRNTFVPVSRLPREVLSHIIFDLVVHAKPHLFGIIPPYIVLTHVCREWRRLAIENSALWTKPDFGNAALSKMMLERAGSMPLTMSFASTRVEFAFQHADKLSRIKELNVRLGYSGVPELLGVLMKPMPLLNTLNIQCVPGIGTLPSEYLEHVQKSPLKHLFLFDCTIPWSSNCLTGLTSLSIFFHASTLRDDACITHSALLQMLARIPSLVELRLLSLMSSEEKLPDVPAQSQLVTLRKLELLHIEGSLHDSVLSHFLVSLQVPRLNYIVLPEITTATNANYARLIDCTFKFLRNIDSSMQLRSASVTSSTTSSTATDSDRDVSLRFALSCARAGSHKTFDLCLSFSPGFAVHASDVQYVVKTIMDALPTDYLVKIAMNNTGLSADRVQLDEVWKAASLLPLLEELTITHDLALGPDLAPLHYLRLDEAPGSPEHFPALKSCSWKSTSHNPFRKTSWKNILMAFVEATGPRTALSETKLPAKFRLHQQWCTPKASAPINEAKVRVHRSEVIGEFEGIDDADNGMDVILGPPEQKQRQRK